MGEDENGPRGDSPLTLVERNSYANLMLLCLEHHKIIDDHPDEYTVDLLLEMKANHEAWFASLRSPEAARREAAEMLMINLIDEWEERADIDNWRGWVSSFLWYRLWIDDEIYDRLHQLSVWIYSRSWPNAYPTLPRVFENFGRVANDLKVAVELALTPRSELQVDDPEPAREYIPDHKSHRLWLTEAQRRESIAEAEWTRALFGDLALELTRAANWILDEIRLVVDPTYQSKLGVLLLQREAGLGSVYDRPRYSASEIECDGYPYEGLRAFLLVRGQRDMVLGSGFDRIGYRRMTPAVFAVDDEYEDLEALNSASRACE